MEEVVVVMVVEVEDVTVTEEVEALQMEVGKDSVSTVSLFRFWQHWRATLSASQE